ncbi:hypothetical protein ACH5RR_039205, partial [Cinchona calisaya]
TVPIHPNHEPSKRKVIEKRDKIWKPKSDAVAEDAARVSTEDYGKEDFHTVTIEIGQMAVATSLPPENETPTPRVSVDALNKSIAKGNLNNLQGVDAILLMQIMQLQNHSMHMGFIVERGERVLMEYSPFRLCHTTLWDDHYDRFHTKKKKVINEGEVIDSLLDLD